MMACSYEPDKWQLRFDCDQLTKLLCYACTLLDTGASITPDSELGRWWKAHQEADRERERRDIEAAERAANKKAMIESVKARLMSQLTDIEKEALSLDISTK